MPLVLYGHPLSSYCHKALIALYELGAPFELRLLDKGDPTAMAEFAGLWPMEKMPLLWDEAAGVLLPESSIIIEDLDRRFGGGLIPADPVLALEVRLQDRVFDQYIHTPMQTLVGDRLRPEGQRDPFGLSLARAQLTTAYDMVERRMAEQDAAGRAWAVGERFTLADCAAAPALFYADKVHSIGPGRPHLAAYRDRLMRRPSYARALAEAEPYFRLFPG
jgi:glutathione S-transferase